MLVLARVDSGLLEAGRDLRRADERGLGLGLGLGGSRDGSALLDDFTLVEVVGVKVRDVAFGGVTT